MVKLKLFLACKVNSDPKAANKAQDIVTKGIILALDTIFSHRRMAQESHGLTEDKMEGKELTTTEEKCSLKGDVTLNVDGSTLKSAQTSAVAFIARNKDFLPLYCGMAWPIQQDSSLVEAIGVCITIQTALKEASKTAPIPTIIVQTDNKNLVDMILKEKKRRDTGMAQKPMDKLIDKLVDWVVEKLGVHKNLEVTYVPRIRNIAADELTNLARTLTPVVTAKKVTQEYKSLWDGQRIIDHSMGGWIHTNIYWRNTIPDALKGTLLEDLLLVRVGVKEGKQRKTLKVMIATINESQLRKDVAWSIQSVGGLVKQINDGNVKIFVLRCKSEATIEEITFTIYPPEKNAKKEAEKEAEEGSYNDNVQEELKPLKDAEKEAEEESYNDNVKEELKPLAYQLQHYGNVVPPPSAQNGVLVDMVAKYEKEPKIEVTTDLKPMIIPTDLTIVAPHYLEVGGERWDSNILPGQWMNLGCYNLANIKLCLQITTRRAPPKEEETTYLKRIKGIKEIEEFSLPPGKEEVVLAPKKEDV